MHFVFGLSADGRVYPEATEAVGAIDAAVEGPAGLVSTLEAQLGLLGPVASRAVRIASYLAKLRAAGDGRFWAASFEKDPWSTASTLLQWRDDLIAAGWHGKPVGARRIDDLAAAEDAGTTLPLGLADRAVRLLNALPSRPGLRVKRLTLAEPRALLPPLWRRLLEALEAAGVSVDQHDGCVAAAEGSSHTPPRRLLLTLVRTSTRFTQSGRHKNFPVFDFLAKQIFASARLLRSRSGLRCAPPSAVPLERSSQPPKRSERHEHHQLHPV